MSTLHAAPTMCGNRYLIEAQHILASHSMNTYCTTSLWCNLALSPALFVGLLAAVKLHLVVRIPRLAPNTAPSSLSMRPSIRAALQVQFA
jgi:hypothetical protein